METQGPKGKGEREEGGERGMLAGEGRVAGRLGRAGGKGSEKPACPSQEPLENSLICPWRPPSLGGSSRKKTGYGLAISLSPPGVPRALWSQGGSLAPQPGEGPGEVKTEPGVPPAWAELAASDLAGSNVAP